MTTTPAALWLLRLLPVLWFGLILTVDVSAVTETARTLIDEKGFRRRQTGLSSSPKTQEAPLLP